MISINFLEKFLKTFTNLTVDELDWLSSLHRNNYDIFSAMTHVRDTYSEIISRLILNKLPYSIGYKLVDGHGTLFHNIVEKKSYCFCGEVCRNCGLQEAIPLIDAEIEKINRILKDESKVLGV